MSDHQVNNQPYQHSITFFQLIKHVFYKVLRISLCIWQPIYIASLIILGNILEFFKTQNLPLQKGSATSTASGRDANAGSVNLLRYLYTFRSTEFPLDPNLRYFESLFLTGLNRFIANVFSHIPFLLHVATDSEGGFLVARTAMIDRLMIDSLRARIASDDENFHPEDQPSSLYTDPKEVRRFRQILILGAGYDTRGYRFAELRRGADDIDVWVFEVDQSAVQGAKRKRLLNFLGKEAADRVTEGVEFIKCNFDYPGALYDALKNNKRFNAALPTFILWEGVTYYLPKNAIEETIKTLSKLRSEATCQSEWKLVFDLVDEDIFLPSASVEAKFMLDAIAVINSPFQSGLPLQEEQLNRVVGSHGIHVDKVWSFLSILGEMYPKVCKADSVIPFALAECHFTDKKPPVV